MIYAIYDQYILTCVALFIQYMFNPNQPWDPLLCSINQPHQIVYIAKFCQIECGTWFPILLQSACIMQLTDSINVCFVIFQRPLKKTKKLMNIEGHEFPARLGPVINTNFLISFVFNHTINTIAMWFPARFSLDVTHKFGTLLLHRVEGQTSTDQLVVEHALKCAYLNMRTRITAIACNHWMANTKSSR